MKHTKELQSNGVGERGFKTYGPSVGRHHGRTIPSHFTYENGERFDFNRLAIETDGGVVLAQLAPGECVIAPGLIYRRAALKAGEK